MKAGPANASSGNLLRSSVHGCAQVILLLVAIAAGHQAAQDNSLEKHVPQIQAETKARYPAGISTSGLCRRAQAQAAHYYVHHREIDPETMKVDLSALARASEEIVLSGATVNGASAISRSGQDGVTYFDVRVLHSWKGRHMPGDLLTFGIPVAMFECGPHWIAGTVTGSRWPKLNGEFFFVLFLRKDDSGLIQALSRP